MVAGRPPARPAQRLDPDHDGRRDHDHLAVRAVGGRRAGVQPQRDRRRTRAGGAVQGLRRRAGHLAGAGRRVRDGQRVRRPALRGARPARRDREPGRHEHDPAVDLETVRRAPAPRGRATTCSRSAVWSIVGIAVLLALFGPLLAPHDPNASQLANAFVGPGLRPSARVRQPGPRPALAACWSARAPRCSGRCWLSHLDGRRHRVAVIAAWRGRLGRLGDLHRHRHPVRVPGDPAGRPRLRRVRRGSDGADDRAGDRLHAVHRPRAALGGAARARARLHRGVRGAGTVAVAICVRHLMPNLRGLIVAQATLLFGYAMVDFAAISFIGLGVQPPTADWGVMVSTGQSGVLQGYPVESLSAGLCHRGRRRGRQPARRAPGPARQRGTMTTTCTTSRPPTRCACFRVARAVAGRAARRGDRPGRRPSSRPSTRSATRVLRRGAR